jgi:outer membrane receptor protein involved in Fe transport
MFKSRIKNRQYESNDFTTTPDGKPLDRDTWFNHDHMFIECLYKHTFGASLDFQLGASSDYIETQYIPEQSPAVWISWKETRLSPFANASVVLIPERLFLSGGIDYNWSIFGPSARLDNLDPTTGKQTSPGTSDGLITKKEEDNGFGAYINARLKLLSHLHITTGGRLDVNTGRGEQPFSFSPRAAINWTANDFMIYKAVYNSGFLRPANFQRSLLDVRPEQMHQVEVIGIWAYGPVLITLTGFWQELDGVILMSTSTSSSGYTTGFTNTGDYTSLGAELEALYRVSLPRAQLRGDIWGNVSLARPWGGNFPQGLNLDSIRVKPDAPGSNEGNLLNYPPLMFNLGLTAHLFHDFMFISPALRFVGSMEYRTAPPPAKGSLSEAIYQKSPAEFFVDLSLGFEPHKLVGIYVSANNLLDNRSYTPMSVWNGVTQYYGLYAEARMELRF